MLKAKSNRLKMIDSCTLRTQNNFRKTMHSVSFGCNPDFVHAVMEIGIEKYSVKVSGGLPLVKVIGKFDSIRHACATI